MTLVKDIFEIRAEYATGHEPGLVAVLDQTVADSPASLVGRIATVRTPANRVFRARIDGARDHGTVHSLFFKALTPADISVGSRIEIGDEL